MNEEEKYELLIDFCKFLNKEYDLNLIAPDGFADEYLESINKALDETKTVNNNEQTKEDFKCLYYQIGKGRCETQCEVCNKNKYNKI